LLQEFLVLAVDFTAKAFSAGSLLAGQSVDDLGGYLKRSIGAYDNEQVGFAIETKM
jgi:hypothetical protein